MNAAANGKMPIVCVELGSNIEPERYLPLAVAELKRRFPLPAISSVWESPPAGTTAGKNYLNAAVLLSTALPLQALKSLLREIEASLGRTRSVDKFAPRTIDLDILVADGKVVEPALWQYGHLAVPVAEVLPNLRHPESGETLSRIAAQLAAQSPIFRREDVLLNLSET